MVILAKPWPHMVIENYYDEDVFKTLRKEAKKFISSSVDKDTRKKAFQDPDNKVLQDCINSRLLTEDMLLQFPQYREYESLKLFWEVNFLIGPLTYPIHDESSRKVLSCVVYVDPDKNSGTNLYDENKRNPKEIAWKPNTALIFPAIDGVTWHDYSCPKGSYRITINQFLERPIPDE